MSDGSSDDEGDEDTFWSQTVGGPGASSAGAGSQRAQPHGKEREDVSAPSSVRDDHQGHGKGSRSSSGRLGGGEWPWEDRVIASVDLDCFYAQCETLRHPELRGAPVGVQQKLLVVTSNYEVRNKCAHFSA